MKNVCRPGIHAKFEQNPELFNVLCEKTATKTIVESANNRVWGTGMTLGNPECLNRDKWISQGILGELLEEVRAKQHHQSQANVIDQSTTTTPTTEPIANIMMHIANYTPYGPLLQPPPVPDASLYMPRAQYLWPSEPTPNCGNYQSSIRVFKCSLSHQFHQLFQGLFL